MKLITRRGILTGAVLIASISCCRREVNEIDALAAKLTNAMQSVYKGEWRMHIDHDLRTVFISQISSIDFNKNST